MQDLDAVAEAIRELHARYAPLTEGRIADYIPELAKADPRWFGIGVCTVDGRTTSTGDDRRTFTLQSASKPFVYGIALQDHGRDGVLARVGVEPTGDSFNSLIRLDDASKRPHNPMVNAGAIAVTDLIKGAGPTERLHRVLDAFGAYGGRAVNIDVPTYTSERTTGHRNRAIAWLMRHFGMLQGSVDDVLDLYFQQCSILVDVRDLAVMGATLANWGVNPITGTRVIDERYVRDVLSVMYTCGLYDGTGEWAYRVGVPAKSGISGAIVAVVPGRAGIAVFSPPVDARGQSVRALRVFEGLSERFGLHVFDRDR